MAKCFWHFREQRFALHIAVGAQACGDAGELAIVVAGMAADLVGPCRRKGAQNLAESGSGKLAGGGDRNRSIGCKNASVAHLLVGLEARAQKADEPNGEASRAATVFCLLYTS